MKFQNAQFDPLGVVKDTDPHDVPGEVWTDSQNMRFVDNAAEKFGGELNSFTTTAQATHLLFNGNHDAPLWLYFGDGIARATDFLADKDIEGTALSAGRNWDTSLFNLFPIANNAVDAPRYWDKDFSTPGTLATLTAFPANTICESIRPFRSFLVAMNTTNTSTSVQSENRVLWSDQSDAGAIPASWDITDPTTLAGDAYLTDDRGEIIDGFQLRDFFVIYKTHSTYIMRLIGGSSVMRVDKQQVHSGLLAKNCVTEFKGRHFVAADGDIVLFDGQNVESIADKRVRREIFNNIDGTNFIRSHVARYDRRNEIWFCYPTNGQEEVNQAAIWNWRDNRWMFRDLTDTRHVASGLTNFDAGEQWSTISTTWATDTSIWQPVSANPTVDTLASATTLAIHSIDETNDIDGAAFPSRLEKATMDLGDPDSIKLVHAVVPRITANNGTIIHMRVGTQLNPDDSISWSPEQTYTVGTDREAHFSVKGRYISVRMRTDASGVAWKCHGFFLKVKNSGSH